MTINILEFIQNDGFSYSRAASTNGGEFKGPCPWCGGDDRFTVWPALGKYICRRCDKSGDTIQYLRDFRNMKYYEACAAAGVEPEFKEKTFVLSSKPVKWEPRTITPVTADWEKKAAAFLFECFKHLMSSAGKPHRDWLNARGINTNTIKSARLGWNDKSVSFDRETWGLPAGTSKSGKPKSVWIPRGLIIPYFESGKLTRLRIRQENPTTSDRYILAPGSSMAFMDYSASNFDPAKPCVVVEAELDGLLVHQEAGDLVNTFAIGNSTTRPDLSAHDRLTKSVGILAALDYDEAGVKEVPWWEKQYSKTISWMVPAGKDPGEAFEAGVGIRAWVSAGIDTLLEKYPVEVIDAPDAGEVEEQSTIKSEPEPVVVDAANINSGPVPTPEAESEPAPADPKQCYGGYCASVIQYHDEDLDIDRRICLIADNWIVDMKKCPKGRWEERPLCGSEIVSVIVMMPTLKRKFNGRR